MSELLWGLEKVENTRNVNGFLLESEEGTKLS